MRVKVQGYDPYGGATNFINLLCYRLMQEDPELEVVQYQQMQIQGGPGAEAGRYMAHAARMGPDVTTWLEFHNMRSYVAQGFYLPLNEFIGEDKDGDGYISDEEAVWEDWKYVKEEYRRVATVGGKVYGIPRFSMGMAALLYRRDMLRKERAAFAKVGLDPDRRPADFDELFLMLQILTHPQRKVPGAPIHRGQRGMGIEPQGWQFCAWVWAGGGNLVMQGKKNPRTGKTHWYTKEELWKPRAEKPFGDPETGEDLSRQPTIWKATFADEGGMRALGFYRRMCFQKWVRHRQTQIPIDLTDEEAARGFKILTDEDLQRLSGALHAEAKGRPARDRRYTFTSNEVIQGVARVISGADAANRNEIFRRGEVAMLFWVCEPTHFRMLDIPPEHLSLWPVPPYRKGKGVPPAMLAHYHYLALNADLAGEANRRRRQKAWKILATMAGSRGVRWNTEFQVKQGLAKFLDPDVLRRFGLTEYLDDVPEHWRTGLAEALRYYRAEPYEGFWPPIKTKILNNDVLSLALTQKKFDWRKALEDAERAANTGLMFPRTEEEMNTLRPWGWAGIALFAGLFVFVGYKMRRAMARRARIGDVVQRSGPLRIAWGPVLMLAPALLLIGLWKYYPLVRGGVMAFQDYRITGQSTWIGVDNFVNVVLDRNFWTYMRQTFKFVLFSLALGFFTPVIVALLLAEVPRFKILFRTIFFLPQVSTGLVILFLWKLFYDPTASGFLNRILWFAEPIDWLNDPTWAMAAVILPGVWAGAGMGSLIYLAAMKSIPDDLYEAAEVDGAGLWRKIRHVTLPTLLPLLIINFVGTFIGTFHAMGNIFAMTAGGPGNETMVLSLAIWYEAFAFLRFGTATAMAWILGSLLVGFTVMQLRILRRVEFRRAAVE